MMMKTHVVDKVKHFDSQEKRVLKHQVKLILNNLSLPSNTEVCITFVDDDTMRNLNKKYRGIKRTTDVLSFPQDGGGLGLALERAGSSAAIVTNKLKPLILGDIIISIETAKRHAKIYRNSLRKEIQRLIIHGILHLLGYNHKKKREAIKMKKKENKLLSLLNPF
jgi:probable rRNA maturation factor